MAVTLRFKFYRDERLRFLSHLDMQRLFQRAFRRGKIPTAFTNGFNPHIRLAFAGALPLGMITDEEYGDIVLNDPMAPEVFLNTMNAVLPKGLGIIEAWTLLPGADSLAASVAQVTYDLTLYDQKVNVSDEVLSQTAEQFLASDQILIQKRNKKKQLVETDIKPFIQNLAFVEREDEDLVFRLTIRYLNQKCVKPIQVMQALADFSPMGLIVQENMKLHKIQMVLG